jgi:hypothetical protein
LIADNLPALLGYDSGLALKGGFIDLSPMEVFNRIASPFLISKTIISLWSFQPFWPVRRGRRSPAGLKPGKRSPDNHSFTGVAEAAAPRAHPGKNFMGLGDRSGLQRVEVSCLGDGSRGNGDFAKII